MPLADFDAPRLYLDPTLDEGASVALDAARANYLVNVLRLKAGDTVRVFDGMTGEWLARLVSPTRKSHALAIETRLRDQPPDGRLTLLFAPLKHARLDYMVQKAVEMGAARLTPALTRRTQATRLNAERMRANAVEAAEQCGILTLPVIDAPAPLERALEGLAADARLIFCDEDAEVSAPLDALAAAGRAAGPLAVLIGPEGGFDPAEREMLLARPNTIRLSLGPRVLRADTAAVAALALVQAALGDWR